MTAEARLAAVAAAIEEMWPAPVVAHLHPSLRGQSYRARLLAAAGFEMDPETCEVATPMPSSHMTTEQAYDVLCEILGPEIVVHEDIPDATLVRRAKAATHPNRHSGGRTLWDQVEQAARVLGVDR